MSARRKYRLTTPEERIRQRVMAIDEKEQKEKERKKTKPPPKAALSEWTLQRSPMRPSEDSFGGESFRTERGYGAGAIIAHPSMFKWKKRDG